MIARILIWNLYDSKTNIAELREHLPELPEGSYWISNTLLRTLTNKQMLALARSTRTLGGR